MKRKSALTVSQDLLFTPDQERLFDALGDPTRRRILSRLREGPQPVVAIAAHMPVSRPAVSQHLKILKECGLVTDEAVATRRVYSIAPQGVAALRAFVEGVWQQGLDRLTELAKE